MPLYRKSNPSVGPCGGSPWLQAAQAVIVQHVEDRLLVRLDALLHFAESPVREQAPVSTWYRMLWAFGVLLKQTAPFPSCSVPSDTVSDAEAVKFTV